jgi:hypothetical protein
MENSLVFSFFASEIGLNKIIWFLCGGDAEAANGSDVSDGTRKYTDNKNFAFQISKTRLSGGVHVYGYMHCVEERAFLEHVLNTTYDVIDFRSSVLPKQVIDAQKTFDGIGRLVR